MNGQAIKPSRAYYLLAVGLLAAGAAVFAWSITSFIGQVGPIARVVVPGSGEVELTEPGKYTICYEHRSVVDGKLYAGPTALEGMTCSVTHKATGLDVPLGPVGMNYTYSTPGHEGIGVWKFEAAQKGVYVFAADYGSAGAEGPEVVLAVTRGFPVGGMVGMCLSIPLLVLCILGAIITVIVTLVRRVACKKRLAASAAAPPPMTGAG